MIFASTFILSQGIAIRYLYGFHLPYVGAVEAIVLFFHFLSPCVAILGS